MLNLVPCAIPQDLVVYPPYIYFISNPTLPVLPSPISLPSGSQKSVSLSVLRQVHLHHLLIPPRHLTVHPHHLKAHLHLTAGQTPRYSIPWLHCPMSLSLKPRCLYPLRVLLLLLPDVPNPLSPSTYTQTHAHIHTSKSFDVWHVGMLEWEVYFLVRQENSTKHGTRDKILILKKEVQ